MREPPNSLPSYTADDLARIGTQALIERMVRDEDRVPRNVIDECARRGDEMVAALDSLPVDERCWSGMASQGEWWLLLHAIHILGLIASEQAGLLLVRFMRRMAQEGDDDLRDWLAGRWPALFRNKPDPAIAAARALCMDREIDWFMRAEGAEVATAAAHQRGELELQAALDWLAGIAVDEQEDWDLRLSVASVLLDFPRVRHRVLLDELAARQSGSGVAYSADEVAKAYAAAMDEPPWRRFEDPWSFYAPEQIAQRQERWAQENAAALAGLADDENEDAFPDEAPLPFVRPVPKTGRNDPCPCGSGKKYKHCCLTAAAAPAPAIVAPLDPSERDEAMWQRLHRLNDGLPTKLLDFAVELFGKVAIAEAWDEFTLWQDIPFDPRSPHLQVFMPCFFYDWKPDEAETRVRKSAPRGKTVLGAWLERKGRHLDSLERRYLEACVVAPFSFHEIVSCQPGADFRLRDILTGEERDVTERSGSRNARRGDVMFAKVVPIEHLALIDGCAQVVIPPEAKGPVLELRRKLREAGVALTPPLLREYVLELFETYHAIAEPLLNPRMPELQNTDGEVLSFHRIVYDIDSPQAAFDALKELALDATAEELLARAERDAQGTLRKLEFGWLKRGNAQHPEWENTVLGNIAIEGTTLTVEVNSRRRADQFRELADKLLLGRARYRSTVVEATKAMLEKARRERSPEDEARRAKNEALNSRPEVQAALRQHLEGHYAAWPEMKLPALGGKTPLEAMQDPDGREMVEALLLQFERHPPPQLASGYDAIIGRLRERLGLSQKC